MLRPALLSWILLAGLVVTLHAQHSLYVANGSNWVPVERVYYSTPFFEFKGALVYPNSLNEIRGEWRSYQLKLVPRGQYLPVLVEISDLQTKFTRHEASQVNKFDGRFIFQAKFASTCALKNAFLLVSLPGDNAARIYFVEELGAMAPYQRYPVDLDYTDPRIRGGAYEIFLFSDKRELFHSRMSSATIDEALDAMVKSWAEKNPDSAPQRLLSPMPRYPESLLAKQVVGAATIGFLIGEDGRVGEAKLESATETPFGDAALSAVAQWRFTPRLKAGKPLRTRVSLPLNFVPTAPVNEARN